MVSNLMKPGSPTCSRTCSLMPTHRQQTSIRSRIAWMSRCASFSGKRQKKRWSSNTTFRTLQNLQMFFNLNYLLTSIAHKNRIFGCIVLLLHWCIRWCFLLKVWESSFGPRHCGIRSDCLQQVSLIWNLEPRFLMYIIYKIKYIISELARRQSNEKHWNQIRCALIFRHHVSVTFGGHKQCPGRKKSSAMLSVTQAGRVECQASIKVYKSWVWRMSPHLHAPICRDLLIASSYQSVLGALEWGCKWVFSSHPSLSTPWQTEKMI